MGYRLYFYVVEKKVINKIKKAKTIREAIAIAHPDRDMDKLTEDDEYTSVYEIAGSYTGFEFGKLYDGEQFKAIIGKSKKLRWFADGDHDCWVGDKEMVKRAIEFERDRIIKFHKEATESPEKALEDAKHRYQWSEQFFVNLDEDNRDLTTSWMCEHQIFNMVSLYKNTNWKKYTVIFAGW